MMNWAREAIDSGEIPALVAHSIEEGCEVVPAEDAAEFLDGMIAFYEAWGALLEKTVREAIDAGEIPAADLKGGKWCPMRGEVMSEHTPGPWQCIVRDNDSRDQCSILPVGDEVELLRVRTGSMFICHTPNGHRRRAEAEVEANGRLLASAPTLLRALTAAPDPLAGGCANYPRCGHRAASCFEESYQEWYDSTRQTIKEASCEQQS